MQTPDHIPQVGEPVWYYPTSDEIQQPQAAVITYIHNPANIDIVIFQPIGSIAFKQNVRLCQPSDTASVLSPHCRVPPANACPKTPFKFSPQTAKADNSRNEG